MKSSSKIKIVLLTILSIGSMGVAISNVFAWFLTSTSIPHYEINGRSDGAYFAYGNGSAESPFGITSPRHLYNLSWLQYRGMFNKDENNDGTLDKQFYFELAKDVDMNNVSLPPIGTKEHPFLGHFDGKGHKISNLVISNKDTFEVKPNNVDYEICPEIIGFFGVVGSIEGESTYSYPTSTNKMENFTLENLTVESKTSQTLIGLAAGYCNGEMRGVKVSGKSKLDVNGQSAIGNITDKLSDYGLVGYSTKLASSGAYSQDISKFYDSDDDQGSGGDDNDWGGSFNSRLYNRWIYDNYVYTADDGLILSNMINSSTNTKEFDDFKLVFGTTNVNTRYSKTSKSYRWYSDPDRFNDPPGGESVSSKPSSVVYQLRDGCYLPLRFADDNKVSTHIKNTGYLVGATHGASTSFLGSPKLSSYYYSGIKNSLQNTYTNLGGCVADKTQTYTDSNLELLAYSQSDDTWHRVKDSHNQNHNTTNTALMKFTTKTVAEFGFEKYIDSRNSLQNIFESTERLNGVHFETTAVGMNKILNVPSGIKINGTEYTSNYQLPMASINFNLKSTGFINFFAGTYYTQEMNFNFFSIYHVLRNGGTITGLNRLSKIYQNNYWDNTKKSDAITNPKFFYEYNSRQYVDTGSDSLSYSNIVVNGSTRAATPADGTLVFDASKTLETTFKSSDKMNNLMFYFEIPVNNGEFAIGMVPRSTQSGYTGAYMMYLDIGANADILNQDKLTGYSITTKKESNPYPVGVDFAIVDLGVDGGDSICIYLPSSSSGAIIFDIEENEIAIDDSSSMSTYVYKGSKYSDTSQSGKFIVTGDSPGALAPPSAGGDKNIYIDILTTTDEVHKLVINDKLNSDGSVASSTYTLNGSEVTLSDLQVTYEVLDDDHLASIRSLDKAVTLSRSSGTVEFNASPTYEETNRKNVNIELDVTGVSIDVSNIPNDHSVKIGSQTLVNGETYEF